MTLPEALLDSWDRQCGIVGAVASLVTEANRHVKPSDDGMPLDAQLAHIHAVRRFWLLQVSPEHADGLGRSYSDDQGTPIPDLDAIKSLLVASAAAVRSAVGAGIVSADLAPLKGPNATYDNPVLLLQHMIWHDGWHVALIMLGLRLAGQEPPEEWEEPNVWGQWRTEHWQGS